MAVKTKFVTDNGVDLGHKFTTVKTTKDIKENVTRTEAVQNVGNIRNREVANVLQDKKNIGRYIKKSPGEQKQVLTIQPRTVFKSRNHCVVTDQEEVKERRWMSGGKMKSEKIKTEEHVEYDSDDSDCSSSSASSSHSSHYQLRPDDYKTRTEESFTEYFKMGKWNGQASMVKVGEGPHYKSETKEGNKESDHCWLKMNNNSAAKQSTHKQLTQVRSLDNQTKQSAVATTDRRMKQQFGSSRMSSSSVDLRRMGSGQGVEMNKTSVCDVWPAESAEKVYIAKVIESEKTPAVKMRQKKTDLNYYTANRQSANFSSSGHPIRPPRAKEYTFPNCRLPESKKQAMRPERPQSQHLTEKYYFGDSAMKTGKSKYQLLPSQDLGRNYHSTQNLSLGHTKHHQSERYTTEPCDGTKINTVCTNSTYQLFPSLRRETSHHSTQSLSDMPTQYKESDKSRSVNITLDEPATMRSNYKLVPSNERSRNDNFVQLDPEDSMKHYQSTGNIYKSVTKERCSQGRSLVKNEPQHLSVGDISFTSGNSSSREQTSKNTRDITIHKTFDQKSTGQLIFSSERPKKTPDSVRSPFDDVKSKSSHENLSVAKEPTRIIPIDIYSSTIQQSPAASPSTKYRTRVVVTGAA